MEVSTTIGLPVPLIRRSRKILCISALFGGAMLGSTLGAAEAEAPAAVRQGQASDLLEAAISQAGKRLILTVDTARPVPLARLDRLPAGEHGARFLCFSLRALHRRGTRELCPGGRRRAHLRVGVTLFNASGKPVGSRSIAARVTRPSPSKLALALPPARAGLVPHRYRWRVVESRGGCGSRCEASLPSSGARLFRLRPVRVVGCTGGGDGLVTNGLRDHRVVALTFDDGPSSYTEAFADVLRDEHVHATFFEIGQEIAGRETAMRRLLREGNEIGNHSTHHQAFPGYADLLTTSDLIESATHFRPCLFRPPGGAVDAAVIDSAARAGMSTVTWDVDPSDWSTPGSDAVYARVVGAARPGSIVLMHDGGGTRADTLAALPRIIATLRGRGYRFATVTELLGHRLIYRPYG
jgi:peptidoglycan/xylan/chitin deacetylase (PgdA/CDA1 family)